MLHSRIHPPFVVAVVLMTTTFLSSECSYGQLGGGFGQGGGGGGGGIGGRGGGGGQQGGNQGGQQGGQAGGILIDADGVVARAFSKTESAALTKKRLQATAKQLLSADVQQPSPLRKVSLVRLETACEECVAADKELPPELQFLAGLQRIEYIFLDLESHDLILAGPAEGFAFNDFGKCVGIDSGRPALRLDDLVVSLRVLQGDGRIGCSIDPVAANLEKFLEFRKRHTAPSSTAAVRQQFEELTRILGMQDISVWGVPADSHLSHVLVEADYSMKRISIGTESSGVRGLLSHIALVEPGGESMQRWWFTPLYDAIFASDDGAAFQLAGQRAQLMAQEELPDASGRRSDAPFTRVSTRKFAQLFTEKFEELAAKSPVFAELQNAIDLAIVAALVKKERLAEKVGWQMALFLDEERAPIIRGSIPRQVPSISNTKSARRLIIGVFGGVKVDAMQTVQSLGLKTDPAKRLDSIRAAAVQQSHPESHPWWWD